MITPIALQGTFTNGDGSAAAGTVIARPNSVMVNSGVEYPSTPVAGLLDGNGRVIAQSAYALEVNANDDADTTPSGSSTTITIKLDGTTIREFSATIPADSTATERDGATDSTDVVTFTTLIVAEAMVDQPITGTHIPGGTTVLSVDTPTNKATLSQAASGTQASGCQFVVGGAVEITALQANAL